ncbi:pantoate--beta-alanine ligase [Lentibacillus sp. N15]|uniref:pantoate--beta-alanine ligase n=1 Tax=Lentibacillus songyuanensis TaxID=3136161 RepID=UPI0031B9F2A7
MEIIRSLNDMQTKSRTIIQQQQSIGLVPTMGFFHEGHLSLMKQAKKENDVVVTSIFVNPLQFGPNEDYERYPRNEENDIMLAENVGVDIIFIPDAAEMYPEKPLISMSIDKRADVLCGRSRPGHFAGVLTVLTKLFHLIHPSRAYFGLKDAQQFAVVDALISDLNFPIQLIGLPTVREMDGLAKSSRNVNLSDSERSEAVALYQALQAGRQLAVDGEKNPAIIVEEVMNRIEQETSGSIDYVELLSYPALKPVSKVDQRVILAVALQFTKARLIDNLIWDKDSRPVNFIK